MDLDSILKGLAQLRRGVTPYHPATFKELEIKTAKAVKMYNQQKPHQSLGGLTPDQFERNKNLTKTNFKTVNSI